MSYTPRTIAVIKQSILDKKSTYTALNNLNSTSPTSIVNLTIDMVSYIIYNFEVLFQKFSLDTQESIEAQAVGTLSYYNTRTREFQYGDIPEIDSITGRYSYPIIDEAAKIITFCSVSENNNTLYIKVNKGETGSIEELSTAELNELKAWISKIKFAGVVVNTISLQPDELKIVGSIQYDAIYLLSDVQDAVQAALESYMINLSYDSRIYKQKIIDAIQAVPGVIDVNLTSTSIFSTSIEYPFTTSIVTNSGSIIEKSDDLFLDNLTFTTDNL